MHANQIALLVPQKAEANKSSFKDTGMWSPMGTCLSLLGQICVCHLPKEGSASSSHSQLSSSKITADADGERENLSLLGIDFKRSKDRHLYKAAISRSCHVPMTCWVRTVRGLDLFFLGPWAGY